MVGFVLAIHALQACEGCPRIGRIITGADELGRLGAVTPVDIEDLALMTCDGCATEVECMVTGDRFDLDIATDATHARAD